MRKIVSHIQILFFVFIVVCVPSYQLYKHDGRYAFAPYAEKILYTVNYIEYFSDGSQIPYTSTKYLKSMALWYLEPGKVLGAGYTVGAARARIVNYLDFLKAHAPSTHVQKYGAEFKWKDAGGTLYKEFLFSK